MSDQEDGPGTERRGMLLAFRIFAAIGAFLCGHIRASMKPGAVQTDEENALAGVGAALMIRRWLGISLLLGTVLAGACSKQAPAPDPSEDGATPSNEITAALSTLADSEALAQNLEQSGASVTQAPLGFKPLFSDADATRMRVNENLIYVYRFDSEAIAEASKKMVSPDGSTISTGSGSGIYEWVSTPHFYSAGNLIVLYVGEDRRTKDLLSHALGIEFAGAPGR